MNTPEKSGVILLAHGSPDRVDEIPEFLTYVTGGRPLPPQVVQEVQHRYSLIGQSPLTCWTLQQRDQLQAEVGKLVYVGMRNWRPFIADAVRSMNADGIGRAVAICMAPQNSRTSVGLYRHALAQNSPEFAVDFVESWHDQPSLIAAFAEKFVDGWQRACRELGASVPVIFTAHSVPQRTISEGDPYEAQAIETARRVATAAGLDQHAWKFAFQSQGMSGGAWLGPTVEDTMRAEKESGHAGVFIQPIGFVCDHVEVLYDIDIGFKATAEQLGLRLWRAESLNGSMLLTRALAEIALARLNSEVRHSFSAG